MKIILIILLLSMILLSGCIDTEAVKKVRDCRQCDSDEICLGYGISYACYKHGDKIERLYHDNQFVYIHNGFVILDDSEKAFIIYDLENRTGKGEWR